MVSASRRVAYVCETVRGKPLVVVKKTEYSEISSRVHELNETGDAQALRDFRAKRWKMIKIRQQVLHGSIPRGKDYWLIFFPKA